MIFITGPLYAGKRAYAASLLACSLAELDSRAIWDVQEQAAGAENLVALAERLSDYELVIATEVGGGVVPIDAGERAAREAAGQLSCLLAARAERVIRVFCGLPLVLKGGDIC